MLEPCSNTFYERLHNGFEEDSPPAKATLLIRQKLAIKALESFYNTSWERLLELCEGDYESLFEELYEAENSDSVIEKAEELYYETN